MTPTMSHPQHSTYLPSVSRGLSWLVNMELSDVITSKSFILLAATVAAIFYTEKWLFCLILGIILYVISEQRYKYVLIAIKTMPRDIRCVGLFIIVISKFEACFKF